jgi:hypothetical protein
MGYWYLLIAVLNAGIVTFQVRRTITYEGAFDGSFIQCYCTIGHVDLTTTLPFS